MKREPLQLDLFGNASSDVAERKPKRAMKRCSMTDSERKLLLSIAKVLILSRMHSGESVDRSWFEMVDAVESEAAVEQGTRQ